MSYLISETRSDPSLIINGKKTESGELNNGGPALSLLIMWKRVCSKTLLDHQSVLHLCGNICLWTLAFKLSVIFSTVEQLQRSLGSDSSSDSHLFQLDRWTGSHLTCYSAAQSVWLLLHNYHHDNSDMFVSMISNDFTYRPAETKIHSLCWRLGWIDSVQVHTVYTHTWGCWVTLI